MVLRIPLKIWQQMLCFAQICLPNEVTGAGTLEIINSSELLVTEIFLPNQTVSIVESDFTEVGMHEIITDLIMAGMPEKVEELKFRWHSHGLGSCFFSPKDEDDILKYSGDWVVNLVMNGGGEHSARIDMFRPLLFENQPVKVLIDFPIGRRLKEACRVEAAKKVRTVRWKGVKKLG